MRREQSLPHRKEISGSLERVSKEVWMEFPGKISASFNFELLLMLKKSSKEKSTEEM